MVEFPTFLYPPKVNAFCLIVLWLLAALTPSAARIESHKSFVDAKRNDL